VRVPRTVEVLVPTAGPASAAMTSVLPVEFTPAGPELALWRYWRQNGAMPSVQIKDVPDDVHGVLRERAARAHQSLQEYLLSRLIADASEPTLEEVLERAAAREGGKVSFSAAVRHVRAERDRR